MRPSRCIALPNSDLRFDYDYDFLAFKLVMLTTRSSVNRRTDTIFDSTTTLQTPVKNLVVLAKTGIL